jgi:hypothetical protein
LQQRASRGRERKSTCETACVSCDQLHPFVLPQLVDKLCFVLVSQAILTHQKSLRAHMNKNEKLSYSCWDARPLRTRNLSLPLCRTRFKNSAPKRQTTATTHSRITKFHRLLLSTIAAITSKSCKPSPIAEVSDYRAASLLGPVCDRCPVYQSIQCAMPQCG